MLRSILLITCLLLATCSSTRVVSDAKTRLLRNSQNTTTCHTDSDCDNDHLCDKNGVCQKLPISGIANGSIGCCTSTVPNNPICHTLSDQAHCEAPAINNCSWISTHNPSDCVDDANHETARFRTAPNATKLIVRGDDVPTANIDHCCVPIDIGGDDALNAQCYDQTHFGRSACEMVPSCVWIHIENPMDCSPTGTASRRRLFIGELALLALAKTAATSAVGTAAALSVNRLLSQRAFEEISLDDKRPQVFIEIFNYFPKHTLYRVQEYLDEPSEVEQATNTDKKVLSRADIIPEKGSGIVGLYQHKKDGEFDGIVQFALVPDDPNSEYLYRCIFLHFGARVSKGGDKPGPFSYVSLVTHQPFWHKPGYCARNYVLHTSRDQVMTELENLKSENQHDIVENKAVIINSRTKSKPAAWFDDGAFQIRLRSAVDAPRKFKVEVYPCQELGISTTNSLQKCTETFTEDVKKALNPKYTGVSRRTKSADDAATHKLNHKAHASSAGSVLESFDSARRPAFSRHSRHSDVGAKRYIRHSSPEQPKIGRY